MIDFGRIVAHRGIFDNKDIPENSILSFKKAINYDYPIELDIQLTKDNVLVVFHDFNLYRMTGVNKMIQDSTYDEIKNLKLLNTNCLIPTLSEVLDLVSERVLLNIEIKNTRRITDTCNFLFSVLDNYDNNKYVLQSFNPYVVRYIRNKNINLIVGLLLDYKYSRKIYNLLLHNSFMINYSKANFLSINKKLLNKKQFQKYLLNYPIFVWTIKSSKEMNDLSFSYICNNLPYSPS